MTWERCWAWYCIVSLDGNDWCVFHHKCCSIGAFGVIWALLIVMKERPKQQSHVSWCVMGPCGHTTLTPHPPLTRSHSHPEINRRCFSLEWSRLWLWPNQHLGPPTLRRWTCSFKSSKSLHLNPQGTFCCRSYLYFRTPKPSSSLRRFKLDRNFPLVFWLQSDCAKCFSSQFRPVVYIFKNIGGRAVWWDYGL